MKASSPFSSELITPIPRSIRIGKESGYTPKIVIGDPNYGVQKLQVAFNTFNHKYVGLKTLLFPPEMPDSEQTSLDRDEGIKEYINKYLRRIGFSKIVVGIARF